MTWRIGQRIVCVDSKFEPYAYNNVRPKLNFVYTIREVVSYEDGMGFLLEEIVNRPRNYREGFHECTFRAARFRPVVDRKTDISIFTALLDPSKKLERV